MAASEKTPENTVNRFPANAMMALIGAPPRYDLAESVGPNLQLAELLDASDRTLFDMSLGYGTAAGDPRLRKSIADFHAVGPDDVVITVGGMHALFLLAFVLCERGDEVVTTAPLFPVTRNTLLAVGASVSNLPLRFEQRYQPNLEEFRARLSAKTKLVSLRRCRIINASINATTKMLSKISIQQ